MQFQVAVHHVSAEGLDIPSVPIELKVRGSTSAQQYAKKSFAMNTLNQNQNLTAAKKEDIRLLGTSNSTSCIECDL